MDDEIIETEKFEAEMRAKYPILATIADAINGNWLDPWRDRGNALEIDELIENLDEVEAKLSTKLAMR